REPPGRERIHGAAGGEELEGHLAAALHVLRTEDSPHAARAQRVQHAIRANLAGRHGCEVWKAEPHLSNLAPPDAVSISTARIFQVQQPPAFLGSPGDPCYDRRLMPRAFAPQQLGKYT